MTTTRPSLADRRAAAPHVRALAALAGGEPGPAAAATAAGPAPAASAGVPVPAQDRIVTALRRGLLAGAFPAGTRLREREVAQAFGTGRVPAREALRVLEADGLLRSEPYRGYEVTGLEADAVEEVYEMRSALETLAVRTAVPLLTEADLADLRGIRAAIATATDPAERLDLCERFHFRLYEVAGRPRLVDAIARLRREVVRSFRRKVVRHATEHHDPFFDAVLAADADAAAGALAAHYRRVGALMRRAPGEPGTS